MKILVGLFMFFVCAYSSAVTAEDLKVSDSNVCTNCTQEPIALSEQEPIMVQPAEPLPTETVVIVPDVIIDVPRIVVSSPEKNFPETFSDPEAAFVGDQEVATEEPTTANTGTEPVQQPPAVTQAPALAQVQEAPATVLSANTIRSTAQTQQPAQEIDQLVQAQNDQQKSRGNVVYYVALVGTILVLGLAYFFIKNR